MTLGMSQWQILSRILLPQAMVRMLPAYGSFLTMIIKDTAIASVVATPEMLRNAEVVAQQTYRSVEVYTITMLLYFCTLFPTTRVVELIYRRVAHLGRS